jgi:hypothetical protein
VANDQWSWSKFSPRAVAPEWSATLTLGLLQGCASFAREWSNAHTTDDFWLNLHAATLPETEERVDRGSQDKDEDNEGIFIGNDAEYGDAQYWNPQDTAAVTNPHMMIVGESGSGKTYATLCLTAELANRGLEIVEKENHTLDPRLGGRQVLRASRLDSHGRRRCHLLCKSV